MFFCKVESLRQRCDLQELELQNSSKKVQEAMALAAEESAKSKAAKEVIKSLTAQVISSATCFHFLNLFMIIDLCVIYLKNI